MLSTRFIYNESKYQLLIKKHKDAGVIYSNDLKEFIEYSNTGYVYDNIDDYSPKRNRKILIAFGDIVTDMTSNRN